MQFLAGLASAGLIAGAAAAPQVVDAKAVSQTTTTTTKTKIDISRTTTTQVSSVTQVVVSTERDTTTTTIYATKSAKGGASPVTTTVTLPASTVTDFSTVTLPASTLTLAASTITAAPSTVTLAASTITAPASTVTAPASTVTVYISGSSTISTSTSTGFSNSTTATGSVTSSSTSVSTTTPVYLQYTATPVASVLQAQATALTSSPTSNVEGAAFDRFVVIWLENTDYALAAGDPNLSALSQQGIALSGLYGVTHPSEPNYMASHGGDYFGLDGDGLTFVDASVSSVFDILDTKGISWAEYQEDMPYSGFEGYQYTSVRNNKTVNDYVRKHNPGILYNSAANSPQRLSQMKNLTQFYVDLANNALPQWMFITPNMTSDGHDTSVTTAGSWSANFLQPLLKNPNFNGPKTLILLTFDENHTYTLANNVFGMLLGNAVPANLVNTTDSNTYTHYSQLSTVSANWNLPTLGRWDVGANVYDFVGQQTQDPIVPWTTANGTYSTLANFAFNASYAGPFNSVNNASGKYPVPNTSAVRNGRSVLSSVKNYFAGQSSSYYPGNIGPMIFDGEVGKGPARWW